jgi:hypothetical protein
MTVVEKIDAILEEVRALRVALEGRPAATSGAAAPPIRPFGADGVDTPQGRLTAEEFDEQLRHGQL